MPQTATINFSSPSGTRTPKLRWPTVETLRSGYLAQGMTPADAETQIVADLKKRDQVRAVSLDFESHFVSMMMKEMNKTIEKNELFHGGEGEDMFSDMLVDEQAKAIVSGGKSFGIADMVEQELIRRTVGGTAQSTVVNPIANLYQADSSVQASRDLDTPASALSRVRSLMRRAASNQGWADRNTGMEFAPAKESRQ